MSPIWAIFIFYLFFFIQSTSDLQKPQFIQAMASAKKSSPTEQMSLQTDRQTDRPLLALFYYGLFTRTTSVSRQENGKVNILGFNKASLRWYKLEHMQIVWILCLTANQPCQCFISQFFLQPWCSAWCQTDSIESPKEKLAERKSAWWLFCNKMYASLQFSK